MVVVVLVVVVVGGGGGDGGGGWWWLVVVVGGERERGLSLEIVGSRVGASPYPLRLWKAMCHIGVI